MRNFLDWHIEAVGGSTVSRRDSVQTGDRDIGKHWLVLCSEGTIHDAKNDRVDGTADEPQTGGKEENLKKRV